MLLSLVFVFEKFPNTKGQKTVMIIYNFLLKRERKHIHIMRCQKLTPCVNRNVTRWGIHFLGM